MFPLFQDQFVDPIELSEIVKNSFSQISFEDNVKSAINSLIITSFELFEKHPVKLFVTVKEMEYVSEEL